MSGPLYLGGVMTGTRSYDRFKCKNIFTSYEGLC